MLTRQFSILYREFLFRIVDRELLSTYAKGDASQLMLQIAALLVFMSVCVSVPSLSFSADAPVLSRVVFAWSVQHFMIATTMLVVGILAVLSWGSMFPDHRDVLVLAPLPVRAHTILLAKVAAIATAASLALVAFNSVAGLIWPAVLHAGTAEHRMPALTSDAATSALGAAELQAVMDRDLADALHNGALAPGAGGGVTIGVYKQGASRVFAYGAAGTDSVFQMGSVSKPITGLLLAEMIEAGEVTRDEPVRNLMPAARVPPPPGNEIVLLDLVTHRSGLPGMPDTFRPANSTNPYVGFNVDRLYVFLARHGLSKRRAVPARYSNLGFGLLGHALASRAGTDYATLVNERLARPLGLTDTSTTPTAEQRARMPQGYTPRRQPVSAWDLDDVLAGAGGVYSTAPDMLTWLQANLHPEAVQPATLSAAIVASHEMLGDIGAGRRIGFGWMSDPDTGGIWHGGATAAFTADAYFNRRDDVAVIVLSNTGPGAAVSADVIGRHVRARLNGTPAMSIAELTIPAGGGLSGWLRMVAAYWLTMSAAGAFVFCLAMGVQGVAASLLPYRHFLRVSSFLQLGAFATLLGAYVLQGFIVTPDTVNAAQQGSVASSPSLWFLGLFQSILGSPVMGPLANQARMGLAVVVVVAAAACVLSYVRTLRRIAEEPDITPGVTRLRWLPAFGAALPTAVVQFSLRTLLRSAPHRMILAFYWGIGVALTAVFLKTPRGQQIADPVSMDPWQQGMTALLVSSVLMMVFAVLAARVAFALPRDLGANWIFRITPLRGGRLLLVSRRRALLVVAVVPVWTIAAIGLLTQWPWPQAVGHLVVLALLGQILVECALSGTRKIPFTCAYLPGKSRVHVAVYVFAVLLLPLTVMATDFEREALHDVRLFWIVGSLAVVWAVAWWHTNRESAAEDLMPEFADDPADRVVTLDVWDSRVTSTPAGSTVAREG